MHGLRQRDADHMIFVSNGRIKGDGKPFRIDLPARRRGKLFDEIPSVREIAREGQLPVCIGHTNGNQTISHQGAGFIVNIGVVIQAEGKAFAWHSGGDLPDGIALLDDLQYLFFFCQGDFRRQIIIARRDHRFHQGCMIVDIDQISFIVPIIEGISVRRGYFHQVIPAQGQQSGHVGAVRRGGDGIHQCVLLIPYRAVLPGDRFSGMNLKHSACQPLFLIDGLHDSISVSIFLFLEAGQLQAGFLQPDLSLHGRIIDFKFQQVGFAGLIHVFVAHEYRQLLRLDEIPFGSLELLNEVQAIAHGLRQRHCAVRVRFEGVDHLRPGIMDGLYDIFAVGVFQLKSRIRQGDRLARFGIHLDEFQPVADGLIIQDHAGRVLRVFSAANENIKRGFNGVPFLPFDLLDGVDTIRQQLRLGLAVFVRSDGIPFKTAGSVKGASFFQINMEHGSRLRSFDQARIVMDFIVTCEFHKGIAAIKDFVADNVLIGDDRFLGLLGCAGRIDDSVLVRGLIAGGRR